MALPIPLSRTFIPNPKTLPTVTLAPPPGLVPFRSLHAQHLAFIPLFISCVIVGVTATYVWRLWQSEDKFYVEEEYSEDESEAEGREATAIDPRAMPEIVSSAVVRDGRLSIRENLVAARKEAREKVLQHGISRPFTLRTNLLLDMQGPPLTGVENQQHGASNHAEPITVPLPVCAPPSALTASTRVGVTRLAADDTASYRPTETWDRESSGPSNLNAHLNNASARPPSQSAAQQYYNGSSPCPRINDDVVQHSAQSTNAKTDSKNIEDAAVKYDPYRQSRIDWNDDGSSVRSSEFTKYVDSEFDRSSYTDRYEDY